MKNTILHSTLMALMLSASSLGAFADTSEGTVTLLNDFESGTALSGGYDASASIADNPYSCGNTSSKCCQLDLTETWGVQGQSVSANLTDVIIAVDAYSASARTVNCVILSESLNYPSRSASLSARRWTTLYFDFRSSAYGAYSGNLNFGQSGLGSVYLDNVRTVTAIPEEDNFADCETKAVPADVDYTYGRLCIGGGGFVSGLLSIPGGVKLARTDVGGAYKWDASDCHWEQMFNFVSEADMGLLSVESFAVDPENQNNMYFLCGCNYYSNQKTAVLYTNDGGKTFKESDVSSIPLFVHGNGEGRNNGERLAVDPNNSSILFCGGRVGTPLIKSTNGAKNWAAVSSFPSVYGTSVLWPSWGSNSYNTTANQNGISAVVFDGTQKLANGNTARIFVGVSRSGDSNVYVSEDGGETWSAVSAFPTTYMPLRMKMGQDGNLYAAFADKCVGGSAGAIYKYNPNTKVLSDISPNNTHSFGDVEVCPTDVNKLIVSTNNTWVNQDWLSGQTCNGDIIYTSKDGGVTWSNLEDKMKLTNNNVTWVPGYALHWCGSMCFDPASGSKVSFASGNGIFTCNNVWCDGEPVFYFDVNGLEETVALDMISAPGADPMSVIGDYTGFDHKTVNEFAPIHDPAPGTSNGIAYCPGNSNIMARVSESSWSAQNSYYTTDGGSTWSSLGDLAASKVAISYDASTIAIALKAMGIKYSTNNGSSFTASSGAAAAVYVCSDPVNSNYFYAAGKDVVYASSDGGKNFTTVTLTNNSYTRLCVVPGQEGLVYAPCGAAGLYVSTDHGASYSQLSGLSCCEAIGSGVSSTGSGYVLYAYGTKDEVNGIYRSLDKGTTWQYISSDSYQFGGPGNGKFIVGDQNTFGRFYMSTTGMGIVYGDEVANFEAPSWSCYQDNSTCAASDVEVVSAALTSNNAVDVYPNPFNNSFSMNASGAYIVVDVLGSVIERGNYVAGQNMGGKWNPGIYFVKIDGAVVKVIKR